MKDQTDDHFSSSVDYPFNSALVASEKVGKLCESIVDIITNTKSKFLGDSNIINNKKDLINNVYGFYDELSLNQKILLI